MENNRKVQILRAAAKRFARHGLNKTTLDEIARDLRIGKATLYHYFDSKEQLFYDTIDYDIQLFITDIKIIFNNESISPKERFSEYYSYKEQVYEKYKLLFDTMLVIIRDETLEKEQESIKKLLSSEEEVVKLALNSVYAGRIETMDPSLPRFIILTSWGMLFGNKINKAGNQDFPINSKELIIKSLESIF